MKKVDSRKLQKFEGRVRQLVNVLSAYRELVIHNRVNHSYYMQKAEELKILKEQLDDAEERFAALENLICNHYIEAYANWRRDVRWLNDYLLKQRSG